MTSRNWKILEINQQNNAGDILEESIRNASNKHTPTYTMGGKARKARPLWTNTKTITAVKRKTETYMLYSETRDEQHSVEYRRASNRVKIQVRKAVRVFKRQIAREAKANPKAIYKYARSKVKSLSAVADGTMFQTGVDKAEVVNTFSQVSSL